MKKNLQYILDNKEEFEPLDINLITTTLYDNDGAFWSVLLNQMIGELVTDDNLQYLFDEPLFIIPHCFKIVELGQEMCFNYRDRNEKRLAEQCKYDDFELKVKHIENTEIANTRGIDSLYKELYFSLMLLLNTESSIDDIINICGIIKALKRFCLNKMPCDDIYKEIIEYFELLAYDCIRSQDFYDLYNECVEDIQFKNENQN